MFRQGLLAQNVPIGAWGYIVVHRDFAEIVSFAMWLGSYADDMLLRLKNKVLASIYPTFIRPVPGKSQVWEMDVREYRNGCWKWTLREHPLTLWTGNGVWSECGHGVLRSGHGSQSRLLLIIAPWHADLMPLHNMAAKCMFCNNSWNKWMHYPHWINNSFLLVTEINVGLTHPFCSHSVISAHQGFLPERPL